MSTEIYLGYPPPRVRKWIEENYKKEEDPLKTPLTFTAEEPNSVIKMTTSGSAPVVTLETSIDDGASWQPFTVGSTTITLANVGDKVMFRNSSDNIQVMTANYSNYNKFDLTSGKVAASGNIMFLMDKIGELRELKGETYDYTYCYYSMFSGCTSLTKAPELPATTLSDGCYYDMFYNCTSLTQASELLATTLTQYCYSRMFYNCTSLTHAPALPATTLVTMCYYGMFYNCTSLTNAYFPNLNSDVVIDRIVSGSHRIFLNASENIETQCADKTIIINASDY